MIESHGLAHIQIRVGDLDRTIRFYGAVAGVIVRSRGDDHAFLGTEGAHDIFTVVVGEGAADMGSIAHFGFRLKHRDDVGLAVAAAAAAGGTVERHGERGEQRYPWAFLRDPDGYRVEVFFEE
jgi:catechol 2,3-dioxygenase-like lactoylglutathione lyase family enzyme